MSDAYEREQYVTFLFIAAQEMDLLGSRPSQPSSGVTIYKTNIANQHV